MRITRFKKDPKRLYYYCKLSTALELILPQSQLLLSPITQTNDPRENKVLLFKFSSNTNEHIEIFDLSEKYSKILRDDCKVLCFSQDYKNYQGCHLSKMWAQYGDNHKGVCLELNMDKFIEENSGIINSRHFKKMKYSKYDFLRHTSQRTIDMVKLRSIGEETYIKNNLRNENIDFYFFTKNEEWELELEFRLVHFSGKKENEYCSIADSLELVHLGVDFHSSYIPAIRNLCSIQKIFQLRFLHEGLVCTPLE